MVNCLRGGNDDKEGKRRKGEFERAFLPDSWADFLSLLRLVLHGTAVCRLILRSFNTATALSGSSKELPDLPLAPHPLFCSAPLWVTPFAST